MSANKWTPGPWTMETVRTSVGLCFKVGPFPWRNGKLNHACIYADYPSSAEHAEAIANACLIAQAPDLADALLGCIEHMEWSTAQGKEAYLKAKSALARARGDQP